MARRTARNRYWDLMTYLERRRERHRDRFHQEPPEDAMSLLSTDDGEALADDDDQPVETY